MQVFELLPRCRALKAASTAPAQAFSPPDIDSYFALAVLMALYCAAFTIVALGRNTLAIFGTTALAAVVIVAVGVAVTRLAYRRWLDTEIE